jgi:hypothetical protein
VTSTFAALALVGALSPSANAQPPNFPDVNAFPAVDSSAYEVGGAHPSGSGWVFVTPNGLRCAINQIAELGVECVGTVAGTDGFIKATASLTTPGRIQPSAGSALDFPPLLATGNKIVASGVVCAVPADDTLACRAGRPDTWSADSPDPPGVHYAEHGFVVQPSGNFIY